MSDGSLINAIAWRDQMAVRGYRQAGGSATIPATVPPANVNKPVSFMQLLEWEAKAAMACELELQLQQEAFGTTPTSFPEQDFSLGYRAGAFSGADLWDRGGPILVKYETGGGYDARVFYSDLRPGRVSLGVQQRVRVSVARWARDAPSGVGVTVQGTINPAQALDADPPTFSCQKTLAGSAQAALVAPPGACWWDFAVQGNTAPIACSVYAAVGDGTVNAGGVYFKSTDFATSSFSQYPSSSPWPWLAGTVAITFTNNLVTPVNVLATFWVR